MFKQLHGDCPPIGEVIMPPPIGCVGGNGTIGCGIGIGCWNCGWQHAVCRGKQHCRLARMSNVDDKVAFLSFTSFLSSAAVDFSSAALA
jgi:hypothetical protein